MKSSYGGCHYSAMIITPLTHLFHYLQFIRFCYVSIHDRSNDTNDFPRYTRQSSYLMSNRVSVFQTMHGCRAMAGGFDRDLYIPLQPYFVMIPILTMNSSH